MVDESRVGRTNTFSKIDTDIFRKQENRYPIPILHFQLRDRYPVSKENKFGNLFRNYNLELIIIWNIWNY